MDDERPRPHDACDQRDLVPVVAIRAMTEVACHAGGFAAVTQALAPDQGTDGDVGRPYSAARSTISECSLSRSARSSAPSTVSVWPSVHARSKASFSSTGR